MDENPLVGLIARRVDFQPDSYQKQIFVELLVPLYVDNPNGLGQERLLREMREFKQKCGISEAISLDDLHYYYVRGSIRDLHGLTGSSVWHSKRRAAQIMEVLSQELEEILKQVKTV